MEQDLLAAADNIKSDRSEDDVAKTNAAQILKQAGIDEVKSL